MVKPYPAGPAVLPRGSVFVRGSEGGWLSILLSLDSCCRDADLAAGAETRPRFNPAPQDFSSLATSCLCAIDSSKRMLGHW
ncbi:hypothetical protein DV515_00004708 [Chloebia gouldiae]|uniref:Uncharacterized protein n=1 Tax=Chloebia gouldiae TaxID=44316 RepID=A0A3L8SQQ2_CHLGU|nr:hypothetical protein DV515_00004708 [Chloebia gouldiae]